MDIHGCDMTILFRSYSSSEWSFYSCMTIFLYTKISTWDQWDLTEIDISKRRYFTCPNWVEALQTATIRNFTRSESFKRLPHGIQLTVSVAISPFLQVTPTCNCRMRFQFRMFASTCTLVLVGESIILCSSPIFKVGHVPGFLSDLCFYIIFFLVFPLLGIRIQKTSPPDSPWNWWSHRSALKSKKV
jgi:hypothetical protein